MSGRLAFAREFTSEARDPPRRLLRNYLDRVFAPNRGVQVGAQDTAMKVQRRERFKRSLEAEIEVFEVLAHDHVVDAFRLRERALEALHVTARSDIGEGLLAPAQIVDRGGLAGGRSEERRVGGVDRPPRRFVG